MQCLRYGLRLNLARDGWIDRELDMTTSSTRLSILCERDGWLQRRAELNKSATISMNVQNIGGEFFYPMGRVSSIATISYPL